MKAIRIHKHGGPDVLQIDDLPIPVPAANEVLIRVKAAGLNHLDLWVRRGFPGIKLPLIMGSDAAGVIEDTGAQVRHSGIHRTGQEVIVVPFRSDLPYGSNEELSSNYRILGENLDGLQADYICVPQDYIMPKPRLLNWEEAAAFPLSYLTAYHMLVKKVSIEKAYTILIWGAGSGVGMAAIQIAGLFGAQIITTAGSEEKMSFAKGLGADHVINYKTENVSEKVLALTDGSGVDLVFEHVGEKSWVDSVRSLKKGGKIVTCGATTGPYVRLDLRHVFLKHQQIIGSTMGNRQDLSEVCQLIEAGKFKPVISQVFPAQEIRSAHSALEEGARPGKIAIRL